MFTQYTMKIDFLVFASLSHKRFFYYEKKEKHYLCVYNVERRVNRNSQHNSNDIGNEPFYRIYLHLISTRLLDRVSVVAFASSFKKFVLFVSWKYHFISFTVFCGLIGNFTYTSVNPIENVVWW